MKPNRLAWAVSLLILGTTVFEVSAQQPDADRKLFEEVKARAERGDVDAQIALGALYDEGRGVTNDSREAIKWYRMAADQGNADAQSLLASHFYFGKGVDVNLEDAAKWYRKAGEQGKATAQYMLGIAYTRGDGVATNSTEAIKWLRKAAEQGVAMAQYSFAGCYKEGFGVTQDDAAAAKWYRKSAEQGYDEAQLVLGALYGTGRGVTKDYVESYKWYNLASAQGNKDAKKLLSLIEQEMTAEQVAEAQRIAREFKPRKEANADAGRPNSPTVTGTGFFITEDGFFITNEHVVRDATQVRLVTSAGLITARVVKVDAANDLALLKAEGRFAALPITSSRTLKLGGTVATVGFPNIGLQGFAPKLAKGEIASLSGAADDPRYFQISVPVQPGNSGGALVDERGNVVGVVSAKLSARAALQTSGTLPENVNYAVKSSFLLSFLESVPEVSAKLREPRASERRFEDVVKDAEQAAVLVLVY